MCAARPSRLRTPPSWRSGGRRRARDIDGDTSGPGNRGGCACVFSAALAGLNGTWKHGDRLRLNIFGQPDQTLTRGHGHGLSREQKRFVRTGRGFPEGLIEAWANLYTEFASPAARGVTGWSSRMTGWDIPASAMA